MSSAKKASKTFQQIQYLKNDMLLFGRLYITNQLRERDLDVFFFFTQKLNYSLPHYPTLAI